MAKARLFEGKLNQRLKSFRKVIDTARVLEWNKKLEKNNHEVQASAKEKVHNKGKGKKPFNTIDQGKGKSDNDAKRQWNL